MSCYQIWHHKWENGAKRPTPRHGHDFQSREAGGSKSPGKRKRRRQSGDKESEEDTPEHNSSEAEYGVDAEGGSD
ncbi:hypothetical protein JG688_00016392 [Phytophthora aleatoria]|uniref:Uncharacterized protein n=1 Tax=Phytophthora aleatoria TaxID=2496075 RepID=A0A8J5LYZ7_9STRA|nr:hypothetical protein JG688_00016392 [Phytophthora aleatoria]